MYTKHFICNYFFNALANVCTLYDHMMDQIYMSKALHYYLEVQANPKKLDKKNDAIFSIYGRNGIIP